MAKTNAERQRDWRARQREQQGIVPVMLVAEHEAFMAKARAEHEEQQARIAELQERITLLEEIKTLRGLLARLEEAAGLGDRQQEAYSCPEHGCALACQDCEPEAFGGEEDFG